MKILVSGATGYVGSRLIPRLVASGHEVSCMVRDAARVSAAGGGEHSPGRCRCAATREPGRGDAKESTVAYYLIHSMSASGGDFQQRDLACRSQLRRRRSASRSEPDHLPWRARVRNVTDFRST